MMSRKTVPDRSRSNVGSLVHSSVIRLVAPSAARLDHTRTSPHDAAIT
jgi:hypothetical protein